MNTEVTMTEEAVEIAEEAVRLHRNDALRDTDWAVLVDAPLSAELVTAYRNYRQYLRDLPSVITEEEVMTFSGVKTFEEWQASLS